MDSRIVPIADSYACQNAAAAETVKVKKKRVNFTGVVHQGALQDADGSDRESDDTSREADDTLGTPAPRASKSLSSKKLRIKLNTPSISRTTFQDQKEVCLRSRAWRPEELEMGQRTTKLRKDSPPRRTLLSPLGRKQEAEQADLAREERKRKKTVFARIKKKASVNGKLKRDRSMSLSMLKYEVPDETLDSDGVSRRSMKLPDDYIDPQSTFILLPMWPYILISHDSSWRNFWDSMILCLVLLQAGQAPFELVFDSALSSKSWDILMMVVFIVDFFHNFITTFCDENGDLIIKHSLIIKNYMQSVWFWIDLISSIPVDAANSNFKTMKLMRLARMGKILKRVDNLTRAGAIRFVRLLMIILLIFHWVSCGWFAVGKLWLCRQQNFQTVYKSSDGSIPAFLDSLPPSDDFDIWSMEPFARQKAGFTYENEICEVFVEEKLANGELSVLDVYSASMHQASSTLMGSGMAFTSSEHLFFAFVTMLGAVLQATVFGSVAVLLATLDEEDVTFQKKMLKINLRMSYLNLPKTVQQRVRVFYQKRWDTEKSFSSDPVEFVGEMSQPLATDIKMLLYNSLLRNVAFLQNVSDIVIAEVVNSLQSKLYLEGDLVVRKGEVGDWMGFVSKGQLGVYSPLTSKIIRVLGYGDYLGEMALLYRVFRTVDVRALTWVNINILVSKDFARIKEDYPDESNIMEEELEKMIVTKKYSHIREPETSDEPPPPNLSLSSNKLNVSAKARLWGGYSFCHRPMQIFGCNPPL